MEARTFKDGVYGRLAAVAAAMGSPKRIELIELLAQAERTVEWLAQATGMSVANTSRHLQVLRAAHLVTSRREGSFAHYRLAGPDVAVLLDTVRRVAEAQDAEVERLVRSYFGDRSELDAVEPADLVERVRNGEVVLVDVRPAEEFAAGHLPGAISVPVDRIAELGPDLPADRPVLAYCRGPYCVFAHGAVGWLREAGRDARRLSIGLPEWRAAGGEVEA
ncbi:MAG: metalloregulator ArsR/SmtB family transcription factor [Alphaproteobacteria bacterium]|nr:metalloregulator ArsR/SmtB family transcription factor [Alphaproteobacteria bacterium]MCB9697277.1 metalloregulator ArsR/SmtB family transcription factor [Alphaproteobacteria bacterium]